MSGRITVGDNVSLSIERGADHVRGYGICDGHCCGIFAAITSLKREIK